MITRTFDIDHDWVGSEIDLSSRAMSGRMEKSHIPGLIRYMERIHGNRGTSSASRTERFHRMLVEAIKQRNVERIADHLADQADAVDALLSYYPRRRKPLSDARLEDVRRAVGSHMPSPVIVEVEGEDGSDSLACHRLVVRVPVQLHSQAESLFDTALAGFVQEVTPEENPSLTLDLLLEG